MRTKHVFAITALLALSVTTAGCGGSDNAADKKGSETSAAKNGGTSGGDGDGGKSDGAGGAELRLAKVSDMDRLVQLIGTATLCEDMSRNAEDIDFSDIDGDSSGGTAATTAEGDKTWSIKERAACYGESRADNVHRLILIKNMAQFQAAYKAQHEAEIKAGDGDSRADYFIGQNFAVKLNGIRGSDEEDLLGLGLLALNCTPNYTPPANFKNEQALVDGCVLTDAT
ncbi:hypothetical protein [Streptomyces sp. H27-C3]|uniref:hypothetical protein n=1 Tax=Streptomyces sp. H27-C3 TaxID=3046305 RepID=UPI0024BBA9EB|nr:hypothetical protein [Streptomyces sp. H27-C3]MDJ0464299.1 hypothetical protein [Streptomyces sp. H27-C3]